MLEFKSFGEADLLEVFQRVRVGGYGAAFAMEPDIQFCIVRLRPPQLPFGFGLLYLMNWIVD